MECEILIISNLKFSNCCSHKLLTSICQILQNLIGLWVQFNRGQFETLHFLLWNVPFYYWWCSQCFPGGTNCAEQFFFSLNFDENITLLHSYIPFKIWFTGNTTSLLGRRIPRTQKRFWKKVPLGRWRGENKDNISQFMTHQIISISSWREAMFSSRVLKPSLIKE